MTGSGERDAAAVHVRVEGVAKTFESARDERVLALRDVDLSVGKGEFVAIVGPSGCGKSTPSR